MSRNDLETLTGEVNLHRHALETRLKRAATEGVLPVSLVQVVEDILLEAALALYAAEKEAPGA